MIEGFLTQFLLGLISILSNFLSAFSGGGAGLIQLPALIFLGLPFSKALATHKIASVALGFGASIRHAKEKTLRPNIAKVIMLCGLPGVIVGARLAIVLPGEFTTFFLGILTLFLGIYSKKIKSYDRNLVDITTSYTYILIGCIGLFLIGFLNGSFSSGTGLFVTLWLVRWFRLSYISAVAHTLILVGVGWNSTGAIVLALNNEVKWEWIPTLILGSLIGGYIGASFGIINGEQIVKRSFEFISIIMGLSLIGKGIITMI